MQTNGTSLTTENSDEVASKGCQSDTQTGVSLTSNRCLSDTLTDHKQIIKRRQETEPALSVNDAVKSYNTMATKNRLPSCMGLNNKRKTAIHKLLSVYGNKGWNTMLSKISNTDFLKGKTGHGWRVTFDYAIREDKFLKIIEGGYDSWTKQNAKAHSEGPRRYDDDRPAPKPPKDDWREILVQAGMGKPIEDLSSSETRIKHIHESARKLACR